MGEFEWLQYRLRQFYMDASDSSASTSSTSQRTRCYTDNTTYPNLPPNIIDIPCKQKARYVIVERTYDAPEDDYIGEHGAILEICEIEVYGTYHPHSILFLTSLYMVYLFDYYKENLPDIETIIFLTYGFRDHSFVFCEPSNQNKKRS